MILRFFAGPWDDVELIPRGKPQPFIEPRGNPFERPRKWRGFDEQPGFDHYALDKPLQDEVGWQFRWVSRGGDRARRVEPAPGQAVR